MNATRYDETDLHRAVQAYKFFYPTVSGAAIVKGNEHVGLVANKVFGILDCGPEQLVHGEPDTRCRWRRSRRSTPTSPSRSA